MNVGRGVLLSFASVLLHAATASAASQPPPEPLSPINGAMVQVTEAGVTLTVRAPVANPVYVEAWRQGGITLHQITHGTSDLTVNQTTIPAVEFSPSVPDSLYSGQSGTVYWRPSSTCANEETFELFTCYGETQSFVYSLPAHKLPASGHSQCPEALAAKAAAHRRWFAAQKRYKHAHPPKQGPRLRRIMQRRHDAFRRASLRASEACSGQPK